uniref:Chemosensory protein 10 n=1 Tax=Streltzoviella insularis TaxID=1206366 RepID=A0A7D5YIK7_9NEOP|nr:chemosensory protein 10 [Streltzoviella insularis]
MNMKTQLIYLLLVYQMKHYNAEETQTYTTKYDNVNLDEILASDRLLTGYINCLLDKGPCTPDGKELKRTLPDAITNDCQKCNTRQREGADQVMHYIIDHRTEDWKELEEKYNSDGSYKRKYLESKTAENNTSSEIKSTHNAEKGINDNKESDEKEE